MAPDWLPCSPSDGVYEDGFFGAYTGPAAITEMLAHFHKTGSHFRWEFFDPLADGRRGYACYRFSYLSAMAGAEGKPVVFEGIGHFVFRDGRHRPLLRGVRSRPRAGPARLRGRAHQARAGKSRGPAERRRPNARPISAASRAPRAGADAGDCGFSFWPI